ncbi:winged helix-turn-helix transcriptional regulator [Streptomyces sp. NPDC048448]|uniref:winged helix-turn-helix transcriptional regulator n=1 Tax=Streptomyces sp. NPDC048448 TaxID=3365554 RepID=UPI003713BC8B
MKPTKGRRACSVRRRGSYGFTVQSYGLIIKPLAGRRVQVHKTDLRRASCPINRSATDIGDWWSLLIVRDALSGTTRFNEFQRSLGCARNILGARLAELVERDGLPNRCSGVGGQRLHRVPAHRKGADTAGLSRFASATACPRPASNCRAQHRLKPTCLPSGRLPAHPQEHPITAGRCRQEGHPCPI